MKRLLIACLVLCLSLASGCKKSVNNFETLVKDGKYQKAIEAYEKNIQGDSEREQQCYYFLSDYLEENWNDYLNKEISDESFSTIIRTLNNIDTSLLIISAKLSEVTNIYQDVCASREVYSTALDLIDREKYKDAINNLKQVSNLDEVTYMSAQNELSNTIDLYVAQTVTESQGMVAVGKYDEAINLIHDTVDVVGDNVELNNICVETYTQKHKANIQECINKNDFLSLKDYIENSYDASLCNAEEVANFYMNQIVYRAQEFLASTDYESAIQLLDNAQKCGGFYEEYTHLYQQAYTGVFESRVEESLKSNNIDKVLSLYQDALDNEYCIISAEITAEIAMVQQSFRDEVIDQSILAYKSEGYPAALNIINEALNTLRDDSTLISYRELYYSCIPVKLQDLKVVDKLNMSNSSIIDYFNYRSGTIEDYLGNEYHGYHDLISYGGSRPISAYGTVYLGGSYNDFCITFFPDSSVDSDVTISFEVYGDGILLFSSGFLDRTTPAQTINIDCTNINELKLQAYSSDYRNRNPRIYLTDGTVTRKLSDKDLKMQ